MAYDFKSLTKQADEAINRDKFYTDFEDVDPNLLHQISELTDWLRTKGKGSDVREVIAQLFERTWLENIKEGNANMEVAKARGTAATLSDRLSEDNAEVGRLAGKITQTESRIDNLIANAGNGTVPSELVDLRTNSDGLTFPLAGDAIRYTLDKETVFEESVTRLDPLTKLADATAAANSAFWSFNDKFHSGTIKSIRVKVLASSPVPIDITLTSWDTNKVLKILKTEGTGIVNIPVNDFIAEDFFVSIQADKFAYTNKGPKTGYASYPSSTLEVGKSYNPIWKTDSNYRAAIEVVYADINTGLSEAIGALTRIAQPKKTPSGARDFDALKEPGSYWLSANQDQDNPLKNAPNNATYGNYAVFVQQFSKPESSLKFLMQFAITYRAEFGKGAFVRYLLVNSDGSINDTDKNIRTWMSLSSSGTSGTASSQNYARNELFVAGDSITAGHPYESEEGLHWPVQVAKSLGYNLTRGARNGAGWLHLSGTTNAIKIANDNDFSLYNVAVFAFGTNDYGNNVPLGTVDDLYPAQQTVLGAVNYVVKKIYEKNPKITLIVSTPLNRLNAYPSNFVINEKGGYGSRNGVGYTLSELTDKMIEVCQKYGILYIDNRQSPFNLLSMSSLLGDRLHPNRDGYQILGQYLSARIGSLIRPYAD